MKTIYKVALLIVAIIVGFMYYGCESNPCDPVEETDKISIEPLWCIIGAEEGQLKEYQFSCYAIKIIENSNDKYLSFLSTDNSLAYSFNMDDVQNGSTIIYKPDMSIISDQPLCCWIEVFEQGHLIRYWFSCYTIKIVENEDAKYLSFFYIDNSLAYSFDIDNIQNGSLIKYYPDCD